MQLAQSPFPFLPTLDGSVAVKFSGPFDTDIDDPFPAHCKLTLLNSGNRFQPQCQPLANLLSPPGGAVSLAAST